MRLIIMNPSDIMHPLSPCTQHLTQLLFLGKLPNHIESLFKGISTHNPMLEYLAIGCVPTPGELLPLVSNLSRLVNLEKVRLHFGPKLFEDAKSLAVIDYLQSCPHLTELSLSFPRLKCPTEPTLNSVEMFSALFSYLEPLLVNKLKIIHLVRIVLDSSAAKVLSRSLQTQHCSLVTLELRKCCYMYLFDAFKQLAIGIDRNTSLRSIGLFKCELGSSEFKVLADTLRVNETLKEVTIRPESPERLIAEGWIQALKQCNPNIAFSFKGLDTQTLK